MSARRPLIAAGGALAAAAVLAATAFAAYELAPHSRVSALPSPPDGISLATDITPRTTFFGDRVTASATSVVDTRKIDPRTVHGTFDFTPFTVVGRRTSTRSAGAIRVVRTTWTLLCLDTACLPGPRGHAYGVAPTELGYRLRRDGVRRALSTPFEAVTLISRVAPAAVKHPRFRVPSPVLTPPRYRATPALVAALLIGGGTLLCALGLLLAGRLLWTRLRPRRAEPSAFERVLRELRQAATSNGDSGRRRRALERLAELVEPLDGDLTAETRALAWAPQDPDLDAIDALARRAREAGER